jgi:plasmid stabilization system protein ParE
VLPTFRRTDRAYDLPAYSFPQNGTEPGRPGHRSGTRELPLSPLPYVVVYAVKPEAIEILHIYHGSQDWR